MKYRLIELINDSGVLAKCVCHYIEEGGEE